MTHTPSTHAPSSEFPEIPGYRLEAVLGRGSTGTVYRAVQLAVDRAVAIKVLHPELAGSKAVRRLQREARTTARLAHPGIVTAIDMGQVAGLWWYAMELVEGSSLSTLLREKGRLSEREAVRLFIPLCEALVHAHEQGVVHRDIKPANILVDTHGRARLVDLGLALTEDDPLLTRTGGTLGTPHYLSPEQARNPQAVDVRSDIWSLGATMFHALCGRPPFNGESIAEILSGVLYAHIPDPRQLEPKLSPGMGLVLRKCLTRSTDRRYATPSELLRDLEALRERRAVRVSARGLDPVAGERERRRRHGWIAAGIVTLLATAAFLYWRPWAADVAVDPSIAAPEARWAELDDVLARAAINQRKALGEALADIDEMRHRVPEAHVKAYYAARTSVQTRFDSAIAAERQRLLQEYEKALNQERNFVRAAALVAPEVELRLAGEFAADDGQRQNAMRRLDLSAQRKQVEEDETKALDRFVTQLTKHYDDVVLPTVQSAQDRGAWVEARDLIRRDLREVIAAATIVISGLTPSKVDDKIGNVRLLVDSAAKTLERAWVNEDGAIALAVAAQQRTIEAQLRRRELPGDAVAAIDAAYAAVLAEHRLVPEQMLVDVAHRSQDALEAARGALGRLQEELAVEDSRTDLAAMDLQIANSWKERRYAEIAAVWERRLAEGWLRPVHAEVELRRVEAELLQGLLERAAQGLRTPGLDSILIGTIERRGKLDPGEDPLHAGFRFGLLGKWETYALSGPPKDAKLLGPEGVERLAGLAQDPKDERASLDRLVRSMFRWREGDADAALRIFLSGPLPRDSHGSLVADLEARLNQAREAISAEARERDAGAERIYNLLKREGMHSRDAEVRIKRINDLLTQFGDTQFVREHEAELRQRKSELAATGRVSIDEQLQAYQPTKLTYPQSGRALLVYECRIAPSAGWNMGDWQRRPEGWTAVREHSLEELRDETLWPRLILERPFDLGQALTVTLEFEQPKDSGPPRFFIASIAGVHVGFAGPSDGVKGQVSASAGGASAVSELIETLRTGHGMAVVGLQRDKLHSLKISLSQGRGKLEASLDGEVLFTQDVLRPEGKGGSNRVVVRSLESILLKTVRIDAGLQNK